MAKGEQKILGDSWSSIVASDYVERLPAEWYSPEYWGDQAQPVDSGGRGAAWFILDQGNEWVLRHYRRGGLVARISERHYAFCGEARTRSVAEFRLLKQLAELKLPVPEAIAAGYRRTALGYEAAILLRRLPSVVPLGGLVGKLSLDRWKEAGQVIRQFHDAGLYHADLNCFNILVGDESVYLIDFDRGHLRAQASEIAAWKRKNLGRLRRSLDKLLTDANSVEIEAGWQALLNGYQNIQ